jgi:hypothetical protein
MRQPPEKLLTGLVQLGGLEAQTQDQRLCPGGRVVGAGVMQLHVGMGHAVVIVGGFRRRALPAARPAAGIALDHEIRGDWSVSGMSCATWPMRHWAGTL